MNRLLALAFCVPFTIAGVVVAQDKKTTPPPATSSQPAKKEEAKKVEQPKKDEAKKAEAPAEMMEDKPGEMHKWLEQQAGEWQASSVEFGPDGKPGKPEKGTMKSKMEFGGRFLHRDFNGRSSGQFFHGEGFVGYSNNNHRFEMSWVDTNMTSMLFLTGQLDAAKKSLTVVGDFPIPGPKSQFKIVSTIVTKDSMKEEMFMIMGGKETKMLEVTYTRGTGDAKVESKPATTEKKMPSETGEKKK